jgi:hypothetical protein
VDPEGCGHLLVFSNAEKGKAEFRFWNPIANDHGEQTDGKKNIVGLKRPVTWRQGNSLGPSGKIAKAPCHQLEQLDQSKVRQRKVSAFQPQKRVADQRRKISVTNTRS